MNSYSITGDFPNVLEFKNALNGLIGIESSFAPEPDNTSILNDYIVRGDAYETGGFEYSQEKLRKPCGFLEFVVRDQNIKHSITNTVQLYNLADVYHR
jgi:hypothetical protein